MLSRYGPAALGGMPTPPICPWARSPCAAISLHRLPVRSGSYDGGALKIALARRIRFRGAAGSAIALRRPPSMSRGAHPRRRLAAHLIQSGSPTLQRELVYELNERRARGLNMARTIMPASSCPALCCSAGGTCRKRRRRIRAQSHTLVCFAKEWRSELLPLMTSLTADLVATLELATGMEDIRGQKAAKGTDMIEPHSQ